MKSRKPHSGYKAQLYVFIFKEQIQVTPFWLNFDQKSENTKSNKSEFVYPMRSTDHQNLPKHLIELKMVSIYSVASH